MTCIAVDSTSPARSLWLRSCTVPALLIAILYLDSAELAARYGHSQLPVNLLTLGYFLWMLRAASLRLQKLMLIGVAVAGVGEVCFALFIGMYEYRLHNVPLYVPLGHSIIYAAVYQFIRAPWVRAHARQVTQACYALAALFSGAWLLLYNDIYGCLCFIAFSALLFYRRESRLFFAVMFLLVAYLELIGTHFQCWSWPPYLLNQWPAITSANPPSGIAVFYMGFDIACLGFYRLSIPQLRMRQRRLRALRGTRGACTADALHAAR